MPDHPGPRCLQPGPGSRAALRAPSAIPRRSKERTHLIMQKRKLMYNAGCPGRGVCRQPGSAWAWSGGGVARSGEGPATGACLTRYTPNRPTC